LVRKPKSGGNSRKFAPAWAPADPPAVSLSNPPAVSLSNPPAYQIEALEWRLLLSASVVGTMIAPNIAIGSGPAIYAPADMIVTATAVTSSSASSIYGQPLTFTATVSPIGAGQSGTVQFQIDGVDAGSPLPLDGNTAVYSTSTLTAGTHSIEAIYSGDSDFAGSTSAPFIQSVAQLGPWAISDLASFNGTNGQYASGVVPDSSGDLFGTTEVGGASGYGTVFEIADGSTFIATLASFNGFNGAYPQAGIVLDSWGDLFGTTAYGGDLSLDNGNGYGTVFEIAHGSGSITTLASFNGANGEDPYTAGLVIDPWGDLFGTTYYGGDLSQNAGNGYGTVFEIAQSSSAITTLASFEYTDGFGPLAGVVLDPYDNLYGTTQLGGASGDGTVFELADGSSAITTLASFNGANGQNPLTSVALDPFGNIFGTTAYGGNLSLNSGFGDGTVFEIAAGTGAITTLAAFNGANGLEPYGGGVVLDSLDNLFGTTFYGGASSDGTVFEISQGSSAITTLASFNGADGQNPYAGLVQDSSGGLLGVTSEGGPDDDGTVYELTGVQVSIASDIASPIYGQSVTLIATVTPDVGIGPTGTVQFQIDGKKVGNPVPLSGNTAAYTASILSAGSHAITAVYSGDDNFAAAASLVFTQNVIKAAPFYWTMNTLAWFDGRSVASPYGGVALDSYDDLFGASLGGGDYGDGAVFEIEGGSPFVTTLASFDGENGQSSNGVALDSLGNLFGSTEYGGEFGDGTVFELAAYTYAITTLASFDGTNGNDPSGTVVVDSAGNLFGATAQGGAFGDGTVFEIAQGTGEITTLASFNAADGIEPTGVVIDSFGNLFGTADEGGAAGDGSVFEIAQGSGAITTIASFNSANGREPSGGVVIDTSGNLFGATYSGGKHGDGTVYEIASDSTLITTLAAFNGLNGQFPVAGVILDSSGNLYGTGYGGGAYGQGSVFEVTRGSNLISTLASFNGTNGQFPNALAIDAWGDLFGTTMNGGDPGESPGAGTAFELVPTPGTAAAVTSNNAAPVYGQPLTFTATITPIIGVGPTGTVQFQIDGKNSGNPVPLTGNTAVYTTSALSAGSHSVLAIYNGDDNYTSITSPVITQEIAPATMLAANTAYFKLDADAQHIDIWYNATASGAPEQSFLDSDISAIAVTSPPGDDHYILDYSNGDPFPVDGISFAGGAGQNTLEIVGNPPSDSAPVAIDSGIFALPASAPGAGTLNKALGSLWIASGAELELAQSDSQADQTVFTVDNLAIGGTLDITNNTLLIDESNVSVSQVAAWVQNAANQPSVMSSLVTGPNSQPSRAVGYGDWTEDPLTVPAGDAQVKYVPTGDTNLDGIVDLTDITRAINNLGQSPGYYGGDILSQGIVNIYDIGAIVNDLGATLNAAGDSATTAASSPLST